eukprot:TRINITY_DN4567_c0_g2_i1.p1 TRINITY_DN4567_c0_g2~~TRINITY_DN4567_c0_g2_i1.p1  ORF type:complete len:263 (+),score=33.72 TRINITY_DN4567_c0_g2_i1:83-871(+)
MQQDQPSTSFEPESSPDVIITHVLTPAIQWWEHDDVMHEIFCNIPIFYKSHMLVCKRWLEVYHEERTINSLYETARKCEEFELPQYATVQKKLTILKSIGKCQCNCGALCRRSAASDVAICYRCKDSGNLALQSRSAIDRFFGELVIPSDMLPKREFWTEAQKWVLRDDMKRCISVEGFEKRLFEDFEKQVQEHAKAMLEKAKRKFEVLKLNTNMGFRLNKVGDRFWQRKADSEYIQGELTLAEYHEERCQKRRKSKKVESN